MSKRRPCKFKKGDDFYYFERGRLAKGKIVYISPFALVSGRFGGYDCGNNIINLPENECFKNKTEIIKYVNTHFKK